MSRERTGVLLIRAWMEGEPPALRARIIDRTDVSESVENVTFATTPGGINAAVSAWLDAFIAGRSGAGAP
jgi:hypothetical protein